MCNISFEQQFLVAMPALNDSFFEHALIYLIEHDENGATGIVINKTHGLTANELLEQIDTNAQNASFPILHGGPVKPEVGFVIHKPYKQEQWIHQSKISDSYAVTSSIDILEAQAQGTDTGILFVALGYCGWSAGQLEQEMADNAWLSIDTPADNILQTPTEQRLSACLNTVGISYQQLHSIHGNG